MAESLAQGRKGQRGLAQEAVGKEPLALVADDDADEGKFGHGHRELQLRLPLWVDALR